MKMSYEQGMSGKEIAEIMGVSVSTVNNQKARGLSLMRKSLSVENLSLAVFLLSIADAFGKNFLRN
jgi:RNA polymerase sigma-70 factor (ECF subfamily)